MASSTPSVEPAFRVYRCPVCRHLTDQDKVLVFGHPQWCCRECEEMVFGSANG